MRINFRIEQSVRRAETLIKSGQYGQVIQITEVALRGRGLLEPKLWRLNAVAAGSLGDHWQACQSLWRALSLKFDEPTLANYITALFFFFYYERAAWLLKGSYKFLGKPARNILINTIVEAIWIEAIKAEALPMEAIQDVIDQQSTF